MEPLSAAEHVSIEKRHLEGICVVNDRRVIEESWRCVDLAPVNFRDFLENQNRFWNIVASTCESALQFRLREALANVAVGVTTVNEVRELLAVDVCWWQRC